MIAIIGIKTRSIISARVADKRIQAEVKKLAAFGAGRFSPLCEAHQKKKKKEKEK